MPVIYDSYTDVFGGSPVQPSNVAYSTIDLTGDLTLDWPQSYLDSPDIITRIIDVYPSANGWELTLPDATLVSVGQDFLIVNRGAFNFILNNNAGSPLLTIDAGQAFYYYLTNNSTSAGIWFNYQFGTGTSAADANALQGYGLLAFNNELNTNIVISTTNVTPRNITATDRASLIIWTGGAADFNLPNPALMTDGFYFSLNNEGTGQITINPFGSERIDGRAFFLVNNPGSLTLVTDTINWYSLGFGQTPILNVTTNEVSVTGAPALITLTQIEASSIEQFFTGVLSQPTTIIFPSAANYWFVFNDTSGAFSLGVTVGGATPILIPQGARTIIYTDGTTMYNTPTFVDGQFVRFPNGSSGAPSITFSNDNTTGLYLQSVGTLGVAANSVAAMEITNAEIGLNLPTRAAPALDASPAYSFASFPTTGMNYEVLTSTLDLVVGTTPLITMDAATTTITNNAAITGTLNVTGAVTLTVPLAVSDGGTSITSVATGQLLVGAAANTFSTITPGISGTALLSTGVSTAPAFTALPPFGKILQVVSVPYTNTNNVNINTGILSLTASIIPSAITSKIFILVQLNMAVTAINSTYLVSLIRNGATNIYEGDALGGYLQSTIACSSQNLQSYSIMYLDSPAATTSTAYTLGFVRTVGSTGNLLVNYSTTNAWDIGACASSMTLVEVGI